MKMSIREAINQTLHQEMERDERVIVLGEDVASDQGGVYGITDGLPAKFGLHRVIDTPITESAIVGAAGGAALTGLRPVAELMFVDFLGVCLDQILNQIAKFRYMFGGQARTPVVIRTMIGAGTGTGPQHSQILYPLLAAIPGIKVVTPANAADAKGLLTTAIRDDDPVIFCEHKALYMDECEVPEGEYLLPFGQARTAVEGSDITIVGMSRTAVIAEQAAAQLAQKVSALRLLICARCHRWMRARCLRASPKPGVWWWWMNRTPTAVWPRRSQAWWWSAVSIRLTRPLSG